MPLTSATPVASTCPAASSHPAIVSWSVSPRTSIPARAASTMSSAGVERPSEAVE